MLYLYSLFFFFFFFNDTATTEIYTLSLHDALPISEESKRIAITALAPSSFAFSIIRSIACLRASSRTTVNCETSPWRSDEIPPATVLLKPIARTTRPNVMPRFRSTTMPGSSNAVVTGKAAAVGSGVPALGVVSVMQALYCGAMTLNMERAAGPEAERWLGLTAIDG